VTGREVLSMSEEPWGFELQRQCVHTSACLIPKNHGSLVALSVRIIF